MIGPDEYHELIDDNAYTNAMAAFNLERAADVVDIFSREQSADWQRLSARLGLTEQEPKSWRTVAEALVTGFDLEPISSSSLQGTSSSKRSMSLHSGFCDAD